MFNEFLFWIYLKIIEKSNPKMNIFCFFYEAIFQENFLKIIFFQLETQMI